MSRKINLEEQPHATDAISASIPAGVTLLPTYEELVEAMGPVNRRARWQRFRHSPLQLLLCRMGVANSFNWQNWFTAYPDWSPAAREALSMLPAGFISPYSVDPAVASLLHRLAGTRAFRCILEVGSGVSTVVTALAIEPAVSFVSLEADVHWHERTHLAIAALSLSSRVRLLHAPLSQLPYDGGLHWCHDVRSLPDVQADLLFIDAPPDSVGRIGVLPGVIGLISQGGLIVLDDALRAGERECVESWVRNGLCELRGYLAVGRGIALMTAASSKR